MHPPALALAAEFAHFALNEVLDQRKQLKTEREVGTGARQRVERPQPGASPHPLPVCSNAACFTCSALVRKYTYQLL